MEYVQFIIDFIIHIDQHLGDLMREYGAWTYVILFLIVFCETGLVVTPFLPGDSLLFAAGALCISGGMNVFLLAALLIVAAIIGDSVNYSIGRWIGPRASHPRFARILKPKYLEKTQRFYEKYGAKTIVIARFVPIVRTFAPFMAGVGTMNYRTFIVYNVVGAVVWVLSFLFAGYFFGGLPVVKKNFSLVVLAIIIISVMPAVIEIIKARREPARAA